MSENGDPYEDVADYLDWIVLPPLEIESAMNSALDAKADLREDRD